MNVDVRTGYTHRSLRGLQDNRLHQKIEQHGSALLAELSVSVEQLPGHDAALQQYKAAYAYGSCRYALLGLRKR